MQSPTPSRPLLALALRPGCCLLVWVWLTACGTRAALPAQAPSRTREATLPAEPAANSPPTPSGTSVEQRAGAPATALPKPAEIALDPKQPQRPLPELKVENIGLHIGGGPNDADTKAPFLNAIAERFPAFMDCYRKNDDPVHGGRFGIDLHIARSGGHPEIEQPRTSLKGPEFRACLASVFASVDFRKPKRGPTTISYSLRFELVDAP